MAHLTGNGRRGVLEVKPFGNVFLDTSGGYPCSSVTEFAIRHLGADRILYGSDAAGRNFAVQLGRVHGAAVTERQRRAILGGTAERLLHL